MHVEPSPARSGDAATPAAPLGDAGGAAWLEYDAPWLAVLRRTHDRTQRTRRTMAAADVGPATAAEVEDVLVRFRCAAPSRARPLAVPEDFSRTVPPCDPSATRGSHGPPQGLPMVGNPQTDRFLETLGLYHRITVPYGGAALRPQAPVFVRQPPTLIPSSVINSSNGNVRSLCVDDNEIDLDADDALDDANAIQLPEMSGEKKEILCVDGALDPAEIDLDELEDEGGSVTTKDAGGDVIVFSPPSGVAKKPRTED